MSIDTTQGSEETYQNSTYYSGQRISRTSIMNSITEVTIIYKMEKILSLYAVAQQSWKENERKWFKRKRDTTWWAYSSRLTPGIVKIQIKSNQIKFVLKWMTFHLAGLVQCRMGD